LKFAFSQKLKCLVNFSKLTVMSYYLLSFKWTISQVTNSNSNYCSFI